MDKGRAETLPAPLPRGSPIIDIESLRRRMSHAAEMVCGDTDNRQIHSSMQPKYVRDAARDFAAADEGA
jgi:hypothetical protein